MTTEIAIRPSAPITTLDDMALGEILARSGFFSDARDAAQAIVKVLAGRELGFGPIASMSGVYVINGKPVLSANLMAAAVKRSGRYTYRIKQLDDTACEIVFYERTEALIPTSRFTIEDARQAGALDGKNGHTWKKFPRNMLFARALSNGTRWHCPDIFGGPMYTPEELGTPVTDDGDVITIEVPRPVLPAPAAADTVTGEIFEEKPAPVVAKQEATQSTAISVADAELRFFAKYGDVAGPDWEGVRRFFSNRFDEIPDKPTTTEDWMTLARRVRDVRNADEVAAIPV